MGHFMKQRKRLSCRFGEGCDLNKIERKSFKCVWASVCVCITGRSKVEHTGEKFTLKSCFLDFQLHHVRAV